METFVIVAAVEQLLELELLLLLDDMMTMVLLKILIKINHNNDNNTIPISYHQVFIVFYYVSVFMI